MTPPVPNCCPNCGADVPAGAKSCPECGSDESTGWSDAAQSDRLGLPDENFDYNEYVKSEFGGEKKPRGISWFWWVVAVVVLVLFIYLFVR
ncbi:MAG TPA: zinc-ribbon domain-containing protein [Verrucomicrobiae bacterium]|jgi:uncharacterized membrane protein YvbJ